MGLCANLRFERTKAYLEPGQLPSAALPRRRDAYDDDLDHLILVLARPTRPRQRSSTTRALHTLCTRPASPPHALPRAVTSPASLPHTSLLQPDLDISPTTARTTMAPRQHKLLIANRGEIAMRILRSARDLDLPTVAVYQDADAAAPHALQADEAVLVSAYINQCAPSPCALESWTAAADPASLSSCRDAVLQACRDTGATMIHPGYGFLSENEVRPEPSPSQSNLCSR